MASDSLPVAVIGAGPAGLTAAWLLARRGKPVVVLEQDGVVGGISRTVEHNGFRFDIGGHRFFTKVPVVQRLWRSMLGDDLIRRDRRSRIYYNGKFFDYPLRADGVFRTLGVAEAVRVVASYLQSQVFPIRPEVSFEDWVRNRFGDRLYGMFFKSYTEKVWGIPCDQIGAQWAAQRIKGLSLWTAAKAMLPLPRLGEPDATPKTLIEAFDYPRLGPGMMWEAFASSIRASGGTVLLRARVTSLSHRAGRVTRVDYEQDGAARSLEPAGVLSTLPLATLARMLQPALPLKALDAAERLRYRDFVTVGLMVRGRELFSDQWIYVHDPAVRLGRIQNFGNWSPEMVPAPDVSGLGLEYFCQEGDGLWSMADPELVALGTREVATLGLCTPAQVMDGIVIRMPKAYPVYDGAHDEAVRTIRAALGRLANLQTAGRNGLHKYNNQDHSMVTAMLAAQNLVDRSARDVWSINQDDDYHEVDHGLLPASLMSHVADLESTQPLVPTPVRAAHSAVRALSPGA